MLEIGRVLDVLERQYYQFAARASDRRLSQLVLKNLMEHLEDATYEAVVHGLDTFVEVNRAKLAALYDHYRDDDRATPLLHQAEALLVFSLLDHDPFATRDAWMRAFAPELLAELATIWGVHV